MPGEIVHASERWQEVGGGGAVAAVQLAKLAGGGDFFTALAGDEIGRRSQERLEALGVTVHAAPREGGQRRGFTHIDAEGERTITVIGERIVPHGDDDLPWERLDEVDGVYFTGGDVGALRHARRAGALVATPRADETLRAGGVGLDALVRRANDPGSSSTGADLVPAAAAVVSTEGKDGRAVGRRRRGRPGRWEAVELPGPQRDSYGAGDSFAASVAFGLADRPVRTERSRSPPRGAEKLTGRAPYENQLTADDL